MPFCKRCGKEISANLKVCPVCGAKINYIRDEDDVYDEDFDLDDELGLDELDIDDDEEDEDSYEDDYEDDFADLEDEDD